ncbi:MAG: hypothetical protein Q7K42_01025 [Candidatus Diapherotrites archaeon]|nr:hypothetical protein [Candidatus Diapherotrites archaeon]
MALQLVNARLEQTNHALATALEAKQNDMNLSSDFVKSVYSLDQAERKRDSVAREIKFKTNISWRQGQGKIIPRTIDALLTIFPTIFNFFDLPGIPKKSAPKLEWNLRIHE